MEDGKRERIRENRREDAGIDRKIEGGEKGRESKELKGTIKE